MAIAGRIGGRSGAETILDTSRPVASSERGEYRSSQIGSLQIGFYSITQHSRSGVNTWPEHRK